MRPALCFRSVFLNGAVDRHNAPLSKAYCWAALFMGGVMKRLFRHWSGISLVLALILFGVAYGIGAREKALIIAAASDGCADGLTQDKGAPAKLRHLRHAFCECVAERAFQDDWALFHITNLLGARVGARLKTPLNEDPDVQYCVEEIGVGF